MTKTPYAELPQGFRGASDDAFESLMSTISQVYSLRAGHTLTDDDFEAIQRFDKHFRDESDNAIEAFHQGYTQGLREGGSADIEAMSEKLGAKGVELVVEKTLRVFADNRLAETEQHVRDFIKALDGGYLDCKDDSAFIDALRAIADRKATGASK